MHQNVSATTSAQDLELANRVVAFVRGEAQGSAVHALTMAGIKDKSERARIWSLANGLLVEQRQKGTVAPIVDVADLPEPPMPEGEGTGLGVIGIDKAVRFALVRCGIDSVEALVSLTQGELAERLEADQVRSRSGEIQPDVWSARGGLAERFGGPHGQRSVPELVNRLAVRLSLFGLGLATAAKTPAGATWGGLNAAVVRVAGDLVDGRATLEDLRTAVLRMRAGPDALPVAERTGKRTAMTADEVREAVGRVFAARAERGAVLAGRDEAIAAAMARHPSLQGTALPAAVVRTLEADGVRTIADLAALSEIELLRIASVGRKTLGTVRAFLGELGLTLRPTAESKPLPDRL